MRKEEEVRSVINEVHKSLDAQELRSAKALQDIYSISDEQSRSNLITLDYIPPDDEGTILDISMRKTADRFAKNLEKIGKIDIDEELRNEISLALNVELVEPDGFKEHPAEPKAFKGEEFIRQKQRASMFIAKRTNAFSPALGNAGARMSMIEIQRKMRRISEFQPPPSTSSPKSSLQSIHARIESDNLGVQSMVFDVPPKPSLSPIQIAMISNILQEMLDQLAIIRHTIPANVDTRWNCDHYSRKNADEKYGTPDEPKVIFREEMGLPPLILSIAEKMQRNRTFIDNVLQRILNEIENCGRFDQLESEVDSIVKFQEAEKNLEAMNQIWMTQIRQLRDLIKAEEMNNKRKKERILDLVQQTNVQVDDTIFLSASKLGFEERWEDARLEQQKIKLTLSEQKLLDDLHECLKQQNGEQIVSGEVCTYLEANIKDLEDETMAWTSRYNDEIEQKQSEIDEIKEAIEIQKLELQEMYELRDQRQGFIDACNAEEEEIQRETEYSRAVHNAATIIQSLWKGYMVRHELGQFKNFRAKLKARKRQGGKDKKKRKSKKK